MDDRIKAAVKAVISVSALVIVLRSVNLGRVWSVITGVDVSFFLAAVGISILGQLLSAKKLQILLAAKGEVLSYLRVVHYYYIGAFFNSLLPSTLGGDVVKTYKLFGDTKKREEAVAAVFMERFTGLLALSLIATVAVVLAPVSLPPMVRYAVYGLAVVSLTILALLSTGAGSGLLERQFPPIIERGVDRLRTVHDAIGDYTAMWRTLAVALLISLVFHTALITINIFLATAVGMQVPATYFFVFIPVAAVILFLPISIGGLGVREAVYVYLFTLAGAAAARAVSVSLLFQVISLVGAVIGGAAYALEEYR